MLLKTFKRLNVKNRLDIFQLFAKKAKKLFITPRRIFRVSAYAKAELKKTRPRLLDQNKNFSVRKAKYFANYPYARYVDRTKVMDHPSAKYVQETAHTEILDKTCKVTAKPYIRTKDGDYDITKDV